MKNFKSQKIKQDIYLIRHGKIDYNMRFEDGGYVEVHGQLSDKGKSQVVNAAKEIIMNLDSDKVNIVTSPKRRCFQSADIIITKLMEKLKVDIHVNKGFRDVDILTRSDERPMGSYAVWESNLGSTETWYDGWLRCNKFYSAEENPTKLNKRVEKAFSELNISCPTIIVCHEEVMLALSNYLGIASHRPNYAEVWSIKATSEA